jgi:hypothetical protein
MYLFQLSRATTECCILPPLVLCGRVGWGVLFQQSVGYPDSCDRTPSLALPQSTEGGEKVGARFNDIPLSKPIRLI